jgi:hypothetical protein
VSGANPIYFGINGSEVARFGADGSFLVGTTANGGWSGNSKVEVRSSGNVLSAYATGSSGNALIARVDVTSTWLEGFFYGSSAVGSITTNGTSTAYNTTSDARLKAIVANQRNYRKNIEDLWVGDFTWKSTHKADFGVLAQQTYSVFPGAVSRPASEAGVWEVDYGKLAPLALWGVKDLYSVTKSQNDRLSQVEREMQSLLTQVNALRHLSSNQASTISELRSQLRSVKSGRNIQTAQK